MDRRAIQPRTGLLLRVRRAIRHAALSALLTAGASTAWAYDALSSKFSLIAIPDPQYYTVVQWKNDSYFNTQMNWIVANRNTKNIGFVFGLGDNTQDGNAYNADGSYSGNITPSGMTAWVSGAPSIDTVDPTNHNFHAEWERASAAWGILDSANIPYYTVPGNHDYYHWDQKKLPTEFLQYFGPQRYQNKSWFGGYSPANTSTNTAVKPYAGMNTYSYFSAGGYKFLNLTLQDVPDSGDLTWAQSVVSANPGLPTIISTHEYMDTNGRNSVGNNIWNGLVNKAGNSQIFMVLSGHITGTRQQTSLNAEGKPVFEILTDYQDYQFNTSNGYNKSYANGGGFLRYLDFDLDAKTIHAQSYSAYIASQGGPGYLTTGTGAGANEFTLNFDFAQRFGTPPNLVGASFYWDPTLTHGTNGGGSGTWDASVANWSNGAANVAWSVAGSNDTAVFGGASAGTVTVAAAGISVNDIAFRTPGYVIAGGTVTFVGSTPTLDATSGAATLNNAIAGSSGLTVIGGRASLAGANTFTGGLTIKSGGAVAFTADNNLGGAGQAVSLDDGTLSYTGNVSGGLTTTRVFTIGAGGGTFDVPNPGSSPSNGKLVISGNNKITGAGDITKTGPGWLTIYGNGNNATGNWTINGGVVELGPATGLGSGSVTINNGGELAANTAAAVANPLILNSGSTISSDFWQKTDTATFSGPIAANGAFSVRLGNFYSSGNSQNLILSGPHSGPGSMTIIPAVGTSSSSGKLTLAGDNSAWSGSILIPTGTVAVGPTSGKPLGSGAITLSGGKLALQGQLAPIGPAGAVGAVAVSGFNKDTIYAAGEASKYPSGDNTTNTLMDGYFSYFQDGCTPPAGSLNAGSLLSGGLSGTSLSSVINATPFVLQSLTSANTLQINQGSSGPLTLDTPAAFTRLSVLAASTWAANDTPDVTISFADGTSVTTSYKAYDWSIATDASRAAASAFGATGVDRYGPTQSPGWDQRAFGLYQSDIDLSNIGGVDYSTKLVSSLVFAAASSDSQGRGKTNLFAVSGSARSWLTGPSQSYANAISVTADSSIDISVSLAAALGPLSLSSSKLSVTSSDSRANPYSLGFASTTITGNATLSLADSSSGGSASAFLGAVSGSGTLNHIGSGTSQADSLRIAGLNLAGGKIKLSIKPQANSPAGTSALGNLSIASASQLDLTNNSMVIDYTTVGTLVGDIRQMLESGKVTSSTGGKLGYADNTITGLATFSGQVVDSTSLLIKFTYGGDANLDGQVDISDLGALATSWQTSNVWTGGDFDYSGFVDISDLGILATNWQLGVGSPLGPSFGQALASMGLSNTTVPEPAMPLLLLGGGLLLRRRYSFSAFTHTV